MKKIVVVLLALMLMFTMAACGEKETTALGDTMTLEQIMPEILKGVELPMVMDMPLDAENFEFFAFTPYAEGLTGLASEAAISSIAHSVVLVRAADSETAAKVAADMDANKDPRKWCCVEAEKAEVIVNGSTILLVMSSTDAATAIANNFNALWK